MGGNMKGKGGGKGKGKERPGEGFDEKTKRLAKEVSQATADQNAEGLAYLWKVQDKHLNSSEWWPSTKGKGKDKGAGKGKFASETAKVLALRSEVKALKAEANKKGKDKAKDKQTRGRSPSAGSARSSSAGSNASAASTKSARAASRQEKRERKAKKKDEDKKALANADGSQDPRPTRLCAACLHAGTWASSTKCHKCKKPFAACSAVVPQVMLAASDSAAPPPSSPACDAAMATLQQLGTAAKAREASYLGAAQKATKSVTVVAPGEATPPPPPPPPPPSSQTSALTSANGATATPAAVNLATEDSKDADASATELATLRTKREKLQGQLADYVGIDLEAAMRSHATALDAQIEKLMAKRQQALEPHQLQELISLHRAELCTAMQVEAAAEASTKSRLEGFDKRAAEADQAYRTDIENLLEAHAASQKLLLEERAALVTALETSHAEAKGKVAALQARIDAAQAQVGAAASPAAATLFQQLSRRRRPQRPRYWRSCRNSKRWYTNSKSMHSRRSWKLPSAIWHSKRKPRQPQPIAPRTSSRSRRTQQRRQSRKQRSSRRLSQLRRNRRPQCSCRQRPCQRPPCRCARKPLSNSACFAMRCGRSPCKTSRSPSRGPTSELRA